QIRLEVGSSERTPFRSESASSRNAAASVPYKNPRNGNAAKVTRIRALAYADGVPLEPNKTLSSETLWVAFGDANTLYEDYAERVAQTMRRRGTRGTIQGWCSWYYYYGENTADDVRANLNAILANQLPLDVIVVDDGYETAIGDWTSIN